MQSSLGMAKRNQSTREAVWPGNNATKSLAALALLMNFNVLKQ